MEDEKVCSSCKKSKLLLEFHKNSSELDGYQHTCKECKKEYHKKGYQKYRETQLNKNNKRRDDWRVFISRIKMKGCIRCGECHISCIDFHHRDPKEKEFDVSRFSSYMFNEKNKEKLLKEIEKCDMLCKNCHSKVHWEQGDYYNILTIGD